MHSITEPERSLFVINSGQVVPYKTVPLRHLKFGAVIAVLLVVTSSPALNCMSALYKMNMDEMACCQHHAGDCDMGQQHMSCCQNISTQSPANSIPAAQIVHLDIALHAAPVTAESFTVASQTVAFENDYGSPPAPPGNIAILRT